MWDLIVSVPDHCLSFYFLYTIVIIKLYYQDFEPRHTVLELNPVDMMVQQGMKDSLNPVKWEYITFC